eukprot:CAMPEP_0115495694 /NCGR_PEP_ID=MMETSP0271-20121206/65385_1 /TAXON_ID=71861 /ORGANISM="Scrippsiella trochoidea, Strain CCMP3099" /LENGTH=126 /DNA_ID=CAMNT_0002924347 /DNA_START=78 /DNA_END=459 /DNA_ORIENTATION=+
MSGDSEMTSHPNADSADNEPVDHSEDHTSRHERCQEDGPLPVHAPPLNQPAQHQDLELSGEAGCLAAQAIQAGFGVCCLQVLDKIGTRYAAVIAGLIWAGRLLLRWRLRPCRPSKHTLSPRDALDI